jgi:hypothetical protein
MPARPLRRILAAALLLQAALAPIVPAADAASHRLAPYTFVRPEMGDATGLAWLTGGMEIRFLPPQSWKPHLDAARGEVALTSTDWAASLVLRVVPVEYGATSKIDPAEHRQALLARHPGATILDEFECHAGGHAGRMVSLQMPVAGGKSLAIRHARVPFPGGVIEASLRSPPDQFASHHLTFGQFLNTVEILLPAAPGAGRANGAP